MHSYFSLKRQIILKLNPNEIIVFYFTFGINYQKFNNFGKVAHYWQ
jgi:hypothetical protein